MAASYDLITSYTTTSNGDIDFTSIPSTYTHLLLKISSRDATYGSINSSMYLRFNNDTATNYTTAYGYGNTGDTTLGGNSYSSNSTFIGQFPGTSFASNMWANTYVVIPNYTSNIAKKTNSLNANMTQGSGGPWQTFLSGRWSGTSAINRITMVSDGTYATGTFVQLYGITN